MSENAGLGKIKETRFWRALESLFVGAKVEGKSGFVNLMRVKSAYFRKSARPALEEKIEERAPRARATSFREEIFDKLYTFFSRYFCESGSVYFRHIPRWEETCDRVYAEGQDIALAWKTRRLYYVKSDTLVRSMPVELPAGRGAPGARFYFDASAFENKKNNERCDFIFRYAGKHTGEGDVSAVKIGVARAANGRKTDFDEIVKLARKDDFHLRVGDLERVCAVFNRQTEADFFIHKDAGGFLREQFDFWLHQFMFQKENDFSHKRFLQLQALRATARDTIDFVSQFEDELRRIWEKPKFARAVRYVVTADKLSPALRAEFAAHAGMKAQIKEWEALKIAPQPFAAKKFCGGEKSHRFLPLDTLHFPELEMKTLAGFDNLAEALDGEMWRSDNWQALNTLKKRFAGRVKCVYIDPPFNLSGGDRFEYRTNYKDSSWATMLESRLTLAREFLADDGAIFLRVGQDGSHIARFLLDGVFGVENYKNHIVLGKSPKITEEINRYHNDHDALYFYTQSGEKHAFRAVRVKRKNPPQLRPMHLPGIRWSPIPEEYAKMFSPQNIQQEGGVIRTRARVILGEEKLPPNGRHWALSQESIFEKERDGKIQKGSNGEPLALEDETQSLTDNWSSHVGYSSTWKFPTENHEEVLRRVLETVSCQKDVVVDFFAGIGTTQAVAQKLGRKWLGVEMGEHFETSYKDKDGETKIGVLGRLKKVVSGADRSGISSQAEYRGGGGFFKYGAFEQYEETLRRVQYNDGENIFYDENKSPFEQYVFLVDEKCAARFARLSKSGEIEVDPRGLYPDIDIAESLANILGKQIKKRNADTVEFVDGEIRPLNPAKMSEEQKMEFVKTMRPFVWWGAE